MLFFILITSFILISWPFLTKKEIFLILFINVSIDHLFSKSKYIFISVDSWILIISCIDVYSCSISIVNLTFSNLKRSFIALSVFSLLFFFSFFFSSKGQASFNFMATVIICSAFGAQGNKVCHCFHCFHIYLSIY